MALLGVLLEQANAAYARSIAVETTTGVPIVGLPCLTAIHAHTFTTAVFNDRVFIALHRLGASGAAERVIVAVEDALERMRRRRCR